MADLSAKATQEAQCYSDALTFIAIGETREDTRGYLFDSFPRLERDEITDIMADALTDARKSGVEKEDIDESWF